MKTAARDATANGDRRDTVLNRNASIADHRRPLRFETDAIPVVTPTVAAALARIVRALRATQSREAS